MHRDVAPRVVNMCEILLSLCRLMTAGEQQVSVFIVTLCRIVSNYSECLNVMLYILSCGGRFDKIMDD